jgi:hypothetical protein
VLEFPPFGQPTTELVPGETTALWKSPGQLASQSSLHASDGRHERTCSPFGESSTIGSSGHLRFLFKPIAGIASVSSSAVTNKGNEAN